MIHHPVIFLYFIKLTRRQQKLAYDEWDYSEHNFWQLILASPPPAKLLNPTPTNQFSCRIRSCYEKIFAHYVKYTLPELSWWIQPLGNHFASIFFFSPFFRSLVDLDLFHWSALSSRSQAVKGSLENVPFVRDLPLYLLIYEPIKIHNSGHTLTCLAFLFLSIGWLHNEHCWFYISWIKNVVERRSF